MPANRPAPDSIKRTFPPRREPSQGSRPFLASSFLSLLFLLGLGLGLGPPCLSAQPVVVPLPNAHAHNDYEHPRPLLDALDHGFCNVEADVYLVNDQLLVAHDRDKVHPSRTLQRLYLDPLKKRAALHHDKIFDQGPEFTLMIDFKSAAEPTYAALKKALEPYEPILTKVRHHRVLTNAVRIVISGNRPTQTVSGESSRLVFIDGRIPDLTSNPPPSLVPWISDNWNRHFQWRGQGPLPPADKTKLLHLVRQSHAQGRRLRFWAIPDQPASWHLLHQAQVDLINTDNLSGLKNFLLRQRLADPVKVDHLPEQKNLQNQ